MGKAESLDVFLETRGDLAVVAPEVVGLELMFEGAIDVLNFVEFLVAAGGGT